MAFVITANKLKRDCVMKVLKLESDEYNAKIFYEGDYEQDIKSGTCDVHRITLSCKPKLESFPITLMSGKIFIYISNGVVLRVDEIDEFKAQLDVAKEAAVELQGIMKEYFGVAPEYNESIGK